MGGNLNYPDEARLRNLHGNLVLTVAVRADGSLESIDLVRSSGHPLLDEAAMRTVRLAQPFQPLPVNNEAVDVLHITRTWQYLAGGTLRQRP
jgi:protein TonB